MASYFKELQRAIFEAPEVLKAIKNPTAIEYLNKLLPRRVGFEIECFKKNNFNINDFKSIPNIVDVDVDEFEQRFSIPPGVDGFVCLWNISNALIKNSQLNPDSGVHYHIDISKEYEFISDLIKKNDLIEKNEILSELESWDYKGTYNRKEIDSSFSWIRLNSLKTLEFRIGEMTFNYEILLKRILHASKLTMRLLELNVTESRLIGKEIESLSFQLERISNELKDINSMQTDEFDWELINNVVKNRIKRI